jgi:hypothetical protein
LKVAWRVSGRLAHFPAASKLYRMKLTTAGLGHETKANTYKVGTEKAYHHFNRALDYLVYSDRTASLRDAVATRGGW